MLHFDDYGNINFGVAAAAMGIPLSMALCGAGMNQWISSTAGVDFSNLGGCLDQTQDSVMIRMGYQMFEGCEYPVQTGNK